jgi:hypothetical protein
MSDSDCSFSSDGGRQVRLKSFSSFESSDSLESSGYYQTLCSVASGGVAAAAMVGFSLWFPFFLAPVAASKTYDWAFYLYEPEISHFDNTVWTYGTDYALAVIMLFSVISILRYSRADFTDKLAIRSASLFLGYCISVTAGGYSHQFYTTLESRNSLSFRILWTICVGTVTSASCAMGMSGSEAIRLYQQRPTCTPLMAKLPIIPDSFWISFGLAITAVCAWGGLSFQRPACDIFIAGITQTPSSFYLMIYFYLADHAKVALSTRVFGMVGFIFNAPLLPMYPLLIQYTDWSLASVNTLLHCWLCVAWTMQAKSLREVTQALVAERDEKVAYVRAEKSL